MAKAITSGSLRLERTVLVPLLHEKKPSSPSCQALIHIRTVVCETRAPNEATRYAVILLYPHDRALANDEIASSFRSRHENLTKISSDFETSSATSAACLSAITRARQAPGSDAICVVRNRFGSGGRGSGSVRFAWARVRVRFGFSRPGSGSVRICLPSSGSVRNRIGSESDRIPH